MKKIIWLILRTFRISDLIQLKLSSYLKDTGWFKSYYRNEAVDKFNNPIPWLTYPFITFVEPRLNQSMNVFEYGSGNSTFWFSLRVGKIVSLEHDKTWYNKLMNKMPANVDLVYKELNSNGEYAEFIKETGEKYDIVIVDGRDRVNCVKKSVGALSDRAVLVFDNSNVECYQEAMQFLKENNFKRIDFYGISPITTISTCTTVFYKENNCLGI
ncbi:MAG: FkbM family methyltransferase [Candidatus Paceibacterota bacterium]